jgi:hypothetical protein
MRADPPLFKTIWVVTEEHFVSIGSKLGQGQVNPVSLNRNKAMGVVHVKHWAVSHTLKHSKGEEANYSTSTSQITEGELQVTLCRMVEETVPQIRQRQFSRLVTHMLTYCW